MKFKLIFFTFLFTFIFSQNLLAQTLNEKNQAIDTANDSCPALFYAVINKEADIVRTYLEDGANPNRSLESCPFSSFKLKLPSSTLPTGAFFRNLFREDIFIDYPEGTTLLHIAAYITAYGDYDIYNLLLKHEADDLVRDENSNPPNMFILSKACVSPHSLEIQECIF